MKTLVPSLPKNGAVAPTKGFSASANATPTVAASAALAVPFAPFRRFSRSSSRSADEIDQLLEPLGSGRRTPNASKPPRHPDASTAEFMAPLSSAKKDELPESVQGYLQLLAESSTSNGSMQRHLVHLLARAAADTQKLTQMVLDPLDGVTDVVADHSSAVIMEHLRKNDPNPARMSMDGGAAPSPVPTSAPVKNAIQGKALSILLSVLMGGLASSAAAEASQLSNALHIGTSTHAMEVTKTAAAAADDLSFFRADSFCGNQKGGASFLARAAPSLTAGISASGASSLLGAGGMATSTALKMLRADSKMRDPDLGNILGHILDTVSESTHSMDFHDMDYPSVQKAGVEHCQRAMANNARHAATAANAAYNS